jgi:hypothetical protein
LIYRQFAREENAGARDRGKAIPPHREDLEAARAFPKLVDLNEETVEDVNYVLDHRNPRMDKVFAKASKCLCFSSSLRTP